MRTIGMRPTPVRQHAARHLDWVLLLVTLAITAMGLVMVYSSTQNRLALAGLDPTYFLVRQITWVLLGLGVMAVVLAVDYRVLRDLAPIAYAGVIAVLFLVMSPIGSRSRGAQAWFSVGPFQLEPSEFAKFVLILAVASYLYQFRGELDAWRLAQALGMAVVPMGLIMIQPDLGTAIVIGVVLIAMLLVAGARPRHLGVLSLFAITAVWAMVAVGALKHYQVQRLTGFLDQSNDTQRSTYNLNQSKIAIGAGGLLGKGLMKGTQTNLAYVPEQHTDFIFTAVGEELGFVGGATLLALFALLVWRTWRIAQMAKDFFGTLVCVGVLAMITFQVFENVGMTMGIMPITGIPLPFMSYGGSAMISSFAAVGVVLNVGMRRFG